MGTGWAGYNLCRNLDPTKFKVICVSPANHFLFTPLLPQTATGTLEFRSIQEPVRTIKGIEYHQAKVRDVDFAGKTLQCEDIFKHNSFEVKYDRLVIAAGMKTNTFDTPGVAEREGKEVFFLKHLYHARQIRSRVLECFERADIPAITAAERARLLSFVVVGGGPTSCEFCAELYDFVNEDVQRWYPHLMPHVRVHLVEASNELLGSFDQHLRSYTRTLFDKRKIDVRTGVSVKRVTFLEDGFGDDRGPADDVCHVPRDSTGDVHHSTVAVLCDGTSEVRMPFGMMVWSAGLAPVKIVERLGGLDKERGRIVTDRRLRVQSNGTVVDDVYAMGDCSVVPALPFPPIAQVAQQHGQYLAAAFNSLHGQPNQDFHITTLGAMVQLGHGEGAVDGTVQTDLQDRVPRFTMKGFMAWLSWRAAYLGKQTSWTNKMLIPMHWFKAWVFGRDISRF